MKKLLLTSAAAGALALVGGNAFAADIIPVPPPPVVVPPPVVEAAYDWTGPYVGLTGGLAVRQFAFPWSFLIDPIEEEGPDYFLAGDGTLRTSAGGFTAGVLAGFNFQRNNVVFGIEGDWNWTNFRSFVAIDGTIVEPPDPDTTFDGEAFVGVDWFATLRARLGFATGHEGRFLPYITGGLAYGKTSLGIDFNVDGTQVFSASEDFKNWGWTVGGGFEYAFNDRMTFKTEYLFVNLGSNNLISFPIDDEEVEGGFNLDVTTRFHTLRAGFTFQF